MLIAYVYVPGAADPDPQAAIRWVITPLVAIVGVLMWQWPKLRRWGRSRSQGGRK
jgi:hypothetical protein